MEGRRWREKGKEGGGGKKQSGEENSRVMRKEIEKGEIKKINHLIPPLDFLSKLGAPCYSNTEPVSTDHCQPESWLVTHIWGRAPWVQSPAPQLYSTTE